MSKEALEGSIKKWERIVKDRRAIDKGRTNCPLCVEYWHQVRCGACPVAKEPGIICCNGTPYEEWYDHHEEVHKQDDNLRRQKDCPECLRLAKEELEFLKSLRKYYD